MIDLKLKYMLKEEKSKRKEYARYKKEMEVIFETQGKSKKFNRMIRKVARDVTIMWKKGLERNEEKVKWSKRKFVKVPESQDCKKQWIERVARGSG